MIEEIQNIKLKHLNRLPSDQYDQYRQVLQYLKPMDTIKGKRANDLMQLTFNEVELIKRSFSNPDISNMETIFSIVFGLSKKELLSCKLIEFFHAYNYVIKQISVIIEQEAAKLKADTSIELQQAGIESMQIFGVLNTLDALALRYGTDPDKVKEWQYGYCFSLLYKMNMENKVQKNYNAIVKANSK